MQNCPCSLQVDTSAWKSGKQSCSSYLQVEKSVWKSGRQRALALSLSLDIRVEEWKVGKTLDF